MPVIHWNQLPHKNLIFKAFQHLGNLYIYMDNWESNHAHLPSTHPLLVLGAHKDYSFSSSFHTRKLSYTFISAVAMGIRLFSKIPYAKQILKFKAGSLSLATTTEVPKGHMAVYVGDVEKKRFVVPISYLNHRSFLDLLKKAEEEFGFNHPTGGLTIPCREAAFLCLTSQFGNTINSVS